jgi:hypothetical protein
MYACPHECRRGFFAEGVGDRIGHLFFATYPCCPTLCTATKFAPLSAPIIHVNLQHDLRRTRFLSSKHFAEQKAQGRLRCYSVSFREARRISR